MAAVRHVLGVGAAAGAGCNGGMSEPFGSNDALWVHVRMLGGTHGEEAGAVEAVGASDVPTSGGASLGVVTVFRIDLEDADVVIICNTSSCTCRQAHGHVSGLA